MKDLITATAPWIALTVFLIILWLTTSARDNQ